VIEENRFRLARPIQVTANFFADNMEPGEGIVIFEGDDLIANDELKMKVFMQLNDM
jgi:hypothetical protein